MSHLGYLLCCSDCVWAVSSCEKASRGVATGLDTTITTGGVCMCRGGGGGQLDIQVHNGYNNLLIYYASSVSIFGICTQTKKSYIKGSREPVLLHNYVCVCGRLNILL